MSTLLRGGALLFLFFLELLAFRVSWEWLELDGAPFPFSHIYLTGLMALAWTVSRILYYGQLRQLKVESDLKASSENLERGVAERTLDLSEANRRLEKEMAIRKQVLANLQESEAKFRALTETVTSAIFIIQGERFVYVKVLLVTGYSLDGQAMELLARGCNGFIQKPFKFADLSRKIREVLTASA